MLELPDETGAKLDIAAKDALSAAQLFSSMGDDSAFIHRAADEYTEAQRLGLGSKDFAAVFKPIQKRHEG